MSLVKRTEKGLYCPRARVYIDPWKPVDRALITHGHSDHARWGHKKYLCTHLTAPVIRHRLGKDINIHSVNFGELIRIYGVEISFHPAGHIPGSAQIRLSYKGETWVITGDYKTIDDGLSTAFEPVECDHFVTESTFALPIYRWDAQDIVADRINHWWSQNAADGKTSIISAYSLGKAQRLIHMVNADIGPIYTHGAIEETNKVLRDAGLKLPPTIHVKDQKPKSFEGALVVAPPSALGSPWIKRFRKAETAAASGWMQVRGIKRRRGVDRGFVLSDHADWDGLLQAIEATGAQNIYATHGYTEIFSQYLESVGYHAVSLDTDFSTETEGS